MECSNATNTPIPCEVPQPPAESTSLQSPCVTPRSEQDFVPAKRTKTSRDALMENLSSLTEVIKSRSTTTVSDEATNFGNLVAAQYRLLNEDQRQQYQYRVQQVYMEILQSNHMQN